MGFRNQAQGSREPWDAIREPGVIVVEVWGLPEGVVPDSVEEAEELGNEGFEVRRRDRH
jgi:hypothetical protein